MLYLNSLVPVDKHCSKCGSSDFYIEKKEKLDFFDLNYAVMTKEEINVISKSSKIIQIWIEHEKCWQDFNPTKFIPLLTK